MRLAWWAYLGCFYPKVTLGHEFDSPTWGMTHTVSPNDPTVQL